MNCHGLSQVTEDPSLASQLFGLRTYFLWATINQVRKENARTIFQLELVFVRGLKVQQSSHLPVLKHPVWHWNYGVH